MKKLFTHLKWIWTPGLCAICLAIVLPPLLLFGTARADESKVPEVLVLHSYHKGYAWTSCVEEGMKEAFGKSGLNVRRYVEYMDTKRFRDPEHYRLFKEFLKHKLPKYNLRLVIATDNNAFAFALKHRDDLFKGLPIIFCGVNGFQESMLNGQTGITGVAEGQSLGETIAIAEQLHPGTREIVVMGGDRLTSDRAFRKALLSVLPEFKDRVKITLWDNLSMAELARRLSSLSKGQVVLLNGEILDEKGKPLGLLERAQFLKTHCHLPIYTSWEHILGTGILGGKLISGGEQGRLAAQLAVRILKGEDPETIPVITGDSNRFMFDYTEMKRFGVDMNNVPPGARVINQPSSFYSIAKGHFWTGLAVMGLLALIVMILLVNIRRRRHTEENLRESEQKYRTLVQTISDIVLVIDRDGHFTYLNPEFEKLTGYFIQDFLGRPFTKLLAPEYIESTVDRFKRGLSGETIPPYEVALIHKDGKKIPVELKVTSLTGADGKAVGRLAIARDIAERKGAEQEIERLHNQMLRTQKMEAIGLMAGGVAHDLNNILSGIVSYPELLLMDLAEDSPLKGPIKTIQESGMRAADVVSDLLTVVRGVAAGKKILNVNRLIEGYLNSIEHQNLARIYPSVAFKTTHEADLLNITCSPTHIQKTLMNLITNASEAIEGAGAVSIATFNRYLDQPLKGYTDVQTGEYVMVTVSDDGSGISRADLERIFEPFYTKKVLGRSGTGLGLAVVWNTVLDHNGYINVKSSEKGTVFELYFPATRAEADGEKSEPLLEDCLGHGEEILVVDDEKRQRKIACGMLVKLGYRASAVSSGEEAVKYVKEHPVDLIVLDMIMPGGINGRKTYEEIIKISPGQKAIVASGYARTEEVDAAQRLGAGQYINKPYTLKKLGVAVKEELNVSGGPGGP